jgi:hypothetical protein
METPDERRMRLVKNARHRELYGPRHHRLRRQWERRIEASEAPICPRCGRGIGPDEAWDLGHDDVDPRIERPEHRACNRGAPNRCITSREW